PNDCSRTRQPFVLSNPYNFSLDIRIPGVIPTEMLSSLSYHLLTKITDFNTIIFSVDFVPHASMDTAHHMILYGCKTPYATQGYWDCGKELGTCLDQAKIMYAWARNAPPTKLPKDVGFKVGGDTRINYFVLQIHYGDKVVIGYQCLSSYLCRLMILVFAVTNADIACTYTSSPMYPFAFRTHTHSLGKVVSGYRVRNGQWTQIGRQSPLLPQAFYPVANTIDVKNGDILAARCVFTGEGRTTNTQIGGTSNDEMCNFYIMYYMDNSRAVPYMSCGDDSSSELFRNIPSEANIPIPVSPDHMMSMKHESAPQKDVVDLQEPKREEEVLDQGAHLVEVSDWPEADLQLGQVSGLALNSNGDLIIFHRGDHIWGINSFINGIYQQKDLGPIQQSTIMVVDPVKGKVLKASGRNMFYMPHGITTDKDDNYWVTDVALHQVIKLSSDGKDRQLLVLGEAFEPGSDKKHFCQPTDVAVDPVTGNVYVSDGYCNSRILKFSPEGKYISHWGADRKRRVPFWIPHSLAFLPDKRELCVADRDNGRIQCFRADTGEFVKEIKKEQFGGEVFAIAYSPAQGGLIYAVNGEPPYGQATPLQGFVINYSTKEILDSFSPDTQVLIIALTLVSTLLLHVSPIFLTVKHSPKSIIIFNCFLPDSPFLLETETFVQANLKPLPKFPPQHPVAAVQKMQEPSQTQPQQPPAAPEEKTTLKTVANQSARGMSTAIITTLLLVPLVLVITIGVFIRWKRGRMYSGNCAIDSLSHTGKAAGSLNLGNFFASHKGYTRHGFDRLSTEGSDLEKDDEDGTDSENEEYSAPPAPMSSS
uniref:Peptidyl-glycine alpha-amidating monooxygenase B-like n=1 Tax=Sinocyclocheilus rhinocerous TaxID=307959 RepID=A0A673GQ55_9TELE